MPRKAPEKTTARQPRRAPRAAKTRQPAPAATPVEPPAGPALQDLSVRLAALAADLRAALAEAPRSAEFQPLADHLYEFARLAPPLLESLRDVPRVMAPLEVTARALQDVSETLHFAHDSFNESLLRLPRADEFEPLAEPLREFARVSPALADALGQVLRLVRPLGDVVARLEDVAGTLQAPGARPAGALPAPDALRLAAGRMDRARNLILEALAGLPREAEYARLAAHLRELATVSPSLLEWLKDVRATSAPLEESVAGLRRAAAELRAGRDELRAALGEAGEAPASGQAGPAGL